MRFLPLLTALLMLFSGCTKELPGEPTDTLDSQAPQSGSADHVQDGPKPKEMDPNSNLDRLYQLSDLKRVTLQTNGKSFQAWVMDTASKRQEGMMFLTEKEVKPEEGMLFVFPTEEQRSFWMSNTYLPLDIIYMDKSGKVLNVQQGKPLDETGLPSEGASLYVLEFRQGGADRFGIKKGAKIKIPATVTARE